MEITQEHAGLWQSGKLNYGIQGPHHQSSESISLTTHLLWPWHSGPLPRELRTPLRTEAELMGSAPCLRRNQSHQLINEMFVQLWYQDPRMIFPGSFGNSEPLKIPISHKATLRFTHSFTLTALPECSLLSTTNHTFILFSAVSLKKDLLFPSHPVGNISSQQPHWIHC